MNDKLKEAVGRKGRLERFASEFSLLQLLILVAAYSKSR